MNSDQKTHACFTVQVQYPTFHLWQFQVMVGYLLVCITNLTTSKVPFKEKTLISGLKDINQKLKYMNNDLYALRAERTDRSRINASN